MDAMNEHDAPGLAQALKQDEANRRSMFEWADRSWLTVMPPLDHAVHGAVLAAHAPRWLELLGVPPLSLQALRGRAGALMALPISRTLSMLRLRALWPRRAQLRHWIDRPRRLRLAACVGHAAADALRRDGAHSLGAPAWLAQASALEAVSDGELAWEGYCLFACDGAWPDDGALPLARVALPREATAPHWLARHRSAGGTGDGAADCEAVLQYLPLVTTGSE
jgi:hypothetical protein